jgi:hypothetical protein
VPLSTSSSSRAQLSLFAKVGIGTVLLMAAYNAYIALAKPTVEINFDAGSENRIIAERYLYGSTPAAVLVGSSLGRALTIALPGSVYNMSFSGDGPLTGLEAVLRRAPLPPVVVVETNVIERQRNDAFIRDLFAFDGLRQFAPAFRTEYRPLHVVITVFDGVYAVGRYVKALIRGTPAPVAPPPMGGIESDDPRLPFGLKLQLETNATVTPDLRERIARNIDVLAQQTAELRNRQVCVILTHLPSHPDIEATPLQRYIDERLRERFPTDRWDWLDIRNDGSFSTVDSIHLATSGATRVADLLMQRIGTATPCRHQGQR